MATDDLNIYLWRLSDGQLLHRLRGHTGFVNTLTFTPDGSLLASGSITDETARVWQVATGRLLHLMSGTQGIYNVIFNPIEPLLATDGFGRTELWDYVSGKLQQKIEHASSGYKHAMKWSPNGKMLAYVKLKYVKLVRKVDGIEVMRFEEHSDSVVSVAWHPNGQMVASGNFSDSVRIWSLQKPHLQHVCQGHRGLVTYLTFSPDGRILASGGEDGTVRLRQLHIPPS